MEDIVSMLLIPVVLVALAFITERGFENLVSKPFFDKYIKGLKPYQPYLVTIVGIGLTYLSRQTGVELVPDLVPFLTSGGDVVTVFAGLLTSVLAMAMHNMFEHIKNSSPSGYAG